ncbi:sensor histidine kinase [Roseococcus sp. YIM B11640]|uniref:sensor histidine kinase n=1 Tax=Roseococcus sp. YIM B11640 TaxID=3133973 RepID=UPI003C79E040
MRVFGFKDRLAIDAAASSPPNPARAQRAERGARDGTATRLALFLLFLIAAALTAALLLRSVSVSTREAQARLDALARSAVLAAEARMQRVADMLLGMQGLADAELVSRGGELTLPNDEFLHYIEAASGSLRRIVADILLFDNSGALLWSQGTGAGPHARATVTSCLDMAGDAGAVQIGRPRRAAMLQQPFVCFRQELRSPSGQVVGGLGAVLDAELLSEFLAGSVTGGEPTVVTLIRDDGLVLARSEAARVHVGASMDARFLDSLVGTSTPVRLSSPLDGRGVHAAWRRVTDMPAILAVGVDRAPHMASVARRQRGLLTIALAGLVILALSGFAAARVIDRRRRRAGRLHAQEGMAHEEADWAAQVMAAGASADATYHARVDADGLIREQHLARGMRAITGGPDLPVMPGGAAARAAFFRSAIRLGRHMREYRLRLADGRGLWLRERCRVSARLPAGEVELVGMVSDIEQEYAQRGRAEASARLELLGKMAASIAHEINQPLATISMAAEVGIDHLARPGGEENARRRLEDIVRQVGRMRDIVEHLRVFSRADQGPNDAVLPSEAVAGALDVAGASLRHAGVTLRIEDVERMPAVEARLVPLEQVIVNLLLNARDAMADLPEEERIVVLAATHDAKHGRVVLSVRDHGHGFAEGELERVFEPFFTTKPPGQGTGLGLPIAYGTVLSFGGDMELHNHPDGGAEASISLIVASCDPDEVPELRTIETQP